MKLTGKLIARVAALLLVAALGAAAQAPAQPAPQPIVLEVTWTLDLQGDDGSSAKIVLEGKYEVEPRGQFPWPCTGWEPERIRDGESFCFWLKYLGGRLVHGEGVGQGEKVTFLDEPGPHLAGAAGLPAPPYDYFQDRNQIVGQGDGTATLHLDTTPGFTWPESQEGARELALGCWGEDWPVPKLTYAELRNLSRLRHAPWSGPVFDPEIGGCHGTLTVDIRVSGGPECEPLKTACERSKSWLACARQRFSDLGGSVTQARLEASAENAAHQSPGVSEFAGYTQLLLALDRLQQTIPHVQARLTTTEGEVAADCGLLPGPEEEKECREAAKRVEDELEKVRARVKQDLETQVALFESSTVPAAGFVARAKLLGQLRAADAQLEACR